MASLKGPQKAGHGAPETEPMLRVEPQPDDVTCGPSCLHAIYRYYGEDLSLEEVLAEIRMFDAGGTESVFLANHALRRGYAACLYTYNLELFDPSWFELSRRELSDRLRRQAAAKQDRRLRLITSGYEEFLQLGGQLRFQDLEPALIRRYLTRRTPLITGLSATYLYRSPRETRDTNQTDDVRGYPLGHFVILTDYEPGERTVSIADPYRANPLAGTHYYSVSMHRLIGAILLGIATYDANLLLISPKRRS